MKLSIATFLLIAHFATGSNLRNLQQTACLDMENVQFGACGFQAIVATIDEAIINVPDGCSNNARKEIMALAETTDWATARQFMIDECESQRVACLDMDLLKFSDCGGGTVLKTVDAALAALPTPCLHNRLTELMLQFDTTEWAVAKQAALDFCVSTLSPCIEDLQALVVPPKCNQVGQQLKTALAAASCTHGALQEVQLHMADITSLGQATAYLQAGCESQRKSCTTWDSVTVNGCDDVSIMMAVREQMADDCTHNVNKEIQLLTGKSTAAEAKAYLHAMCTAAWKGVETSSFDDIDSEFTPEFMAEYVAGDTFLNLETGNFQGNDNPLFPSSARTREVGANIAAFRDAEATTTMMESVNDLSTCANQAMMCCWGRDRQSNDNNGDCTDENCEDQGPADNSNLCYAGDAALGTVEEFPEATEGSIHCHGLAWDQDENDFTARLRYNNFFYVSMYDHMYQRGYVENMVDRDDVPMCGCIEDMPPVVRSDCTELTVSGSFLLKIDDDGLLVAEALGDTLEIEFNACRGVDPDDTSTREDNDLASYVARLVKRNQMSAATQAEIYKTLVGYTEPNDNDNEAACTAVTDLLS